MKKLLSIALALVMAMSVSVSAFATAPVDPADSEEVIIMPRVTLFNDTAYARRNGVWTSVEFSAAPSNGNYIRYWHKNDTGEDVRVYLYRTDGRTTTRVSSMTVKANDQNRAVYYNSTAGSGTYKIVIEAYVSGGMINGDVSAAQYKTRP